MTGLTGIQAIPPDMAVDPPIRSCFSRTSALAPEWAAVNAATMPPPPDPTITRSAAVSQVVIRTTSQASPRTARGRTYLSCPRRRVTLQSVRPPRTLMIPLRAISRFTWAVLVVLAGVSVAGWAVIRHSVRQQDQAVLNNQAAQINLLFQASLQNLRSELSSVAFFTNSASNSADVFAQQVKPLLTSPTTSVGLVDISGGQARVVLAAGPGLQAAQPLPAPLAQAAMAATTQLSSGVVRVGGQPLIYLETALTTSPSIVAFQTSPIQPDKAVANNTGPYSKVYVNLYAGTRPDPTQRILTTYGAGSLPRPIATALTKYQGVTWLIEVSARAPVSGAYTENSPWIALGVGLIVAIGLAALVEVLVRRNRQTAQLLDERTELLAEQRTVSETHERAVLPDALPSVGGTEAAVHYRPGVEGIHVGGDWYDVIAVDDRHVLAVVGDVSGRGLPAASAMASLRFTARGYALQGDTPAVILSKLSRALNVDRDGQFATVLLVLIDVVGRTISVVSGGHPPPLLVHDSGAEFIESVVGPPVGVSQTPSYESTTVPMPDSATLLAFTDGLIERRGEILDVGLQRLRGEALLNHDPSL